MNGYDLGKNVLLHDKYEQIKKILDNKRIKIASNPEYKNIVIDKFIKLSMDVSNNKILYSWSLTIDEYIVQIIALIGMLISVNGYVIYGLITKYQVQISIGENTIEIIFSTIIIIAIIYLLYIIPKKLEKLFDRKNDIVNMLKEANIIEE
jgi:hypothetical protein